MTSVQITQQRQYFKKIHTPRLRNPNKKSFCHQLVLCKLKTFLAFICEENLQDLLKS